jgi:hypothetical protein
LEFQTKQHYRKATAIFFLAGTELKEEADFVSWQLI